ncbi:MAG: TetR family transcriptional regulator [Anaerolineales bacterium]|nr:TetR family transcriptional regulator [Anaerolineales bacterium]
MSPRPNVQAERRQQILQAAMKRFALAGFHKATMDEIAAELPFSKGLLYYYFETKRDIFLALLEDWMSTSISTWESIQAPDESATTQIYQCLEFGVQLIKGSADLTRIELEFYGELGRDSEVTKAFKRVFCTFRASIKEILELGIRTEEFKSHSTDALAAVLVGTFEGLAIQATVDSNSFDWDEITETLCAMVLQGISMSTKE